jgi:hypothetical protein
MNAVARVVLCALGAGVFLFNPAACDLGDDFKYGEGELRAAVEGTWSVTIEPAGGGAPMAFQVRVEQASAAGQALRSGERAAFVTAAMACEQRTLVRSAGACSSSTEMPLAGQVIEGGDALRGQSISGSLRVGGLIFIWGDLFLKVGPHLVSGVLSSAGEASSLRTLSPEGRGIMTGDRVTMTRLSR